MRVRLVGAPEDRARVRRALVSAGLEIAGEFDRLEEMPAGSEAHPVIALEQGTARAGRLVEPLTPREMDVLQVLAEGRSNKAIADALGISDQTVKFHLAAICGKLGAANRTEAVRIAIQSGIITI